MRPFVRTAPRVRFHRAGARPSLPVYPPLAMRGSPVLKEVRVPLASLENTRRRVVVRRAPTAWLEPTPRAQVRPRPRARRARRTRCLWPAARRRHTATARAGMRMRRARTPAGSVIRARTTVSSGTRRARTARLVYTPRVTGLQATRRVFNARSGSGRRRAVRAATCAP